MNDMLYTGPIPDVLRMRIDQANRIMDDGGAVFWKFTCKSCRARQTFDEPNALFITGGCEECGAVTELFSADADVGFDAIVRVSAATGKATTTGPAWCKTIAADEAREAACFDTLRALSPHLNPRGRRIMYAFHGGQQ